MASGVDNTTLSQFPSQPHNKYMSTPRACGCPRSRMPLFLQKKPAFADFLSNLLKYYFTLENLVKPEHATISIPCFSSSSINRFTPKESEDIWPAITIFT